MTKVKITFPHVCMLFCFATVFLLTGKAIALDVTDLIEAESFTGQSGVTTETCSEGGQNITSIQNGDYCFYADMDFGGSDIQCFEARIASYGDGGYIEVRLDSLTGALVGACEIQPETGSWQTWTNKACAVKGAAGIHTVYLKFTGRMGDLFNVNWFKFHGTPTITETGWRQSTSSAKGVWKGTLPLSEAAGQTPTIEILPDSQYQRVDGIGGAFNDYGIASLDSLSASQREAVLQELFDPVKGCKFNIGRVPIGMNDFTVTRSYSLNETSGDFSMSKFSIAHDIAYNIRYIKAAMKYQPNLMLHASPWTPPSWMKNTNDWQGKVGGATSRINKDAKTLNAYALYFRKFVQSWKEQGMSVFVVFPQNEPGWVDATHPSCSWTGAELKDFVRDYLYPDFKANNIPVQIWIGTFHMSQFNTDVKPALDDPEARTMMRGCGLQRGGAAAMLQATIYNPSLHWRAMETENMCYAGANSWSEAMETFGYLTSFYASNANFFTFWNMILNTTTNYVSWMPRRQNSMVVINIPSKSITYTGEFFAMKHFGYYVAPGSVRVKTTCTNNNLCAIAFKSPDGSIVLELANKSNSAISPVIQLWSKTFTPALPSQSMHTFKMGGSTDERNWVPVISVASIPSKTIIAEAKGPLGIYDIKGRLIKVIDRSSAQRNTHGPLWDHTDTGGRKAAPGLYLIMCPSGKTVLQKTVCH